MIFIQFPTLNYCFLPNYQFVGYIWRTFYVGYGLTDTYILFMIILPSLLYYLGTFFTQSVAIHLNNHKIPLCYIFIIWLQLGLQKIIKIVSVKYNLRKCKKIKINKVSGLWPILIFYIMNNKCVYYDFKLVQDQNKIVGKITCVSHFITL